MKLNPILRNESKLAVRNIKFNLTIVFYIGVLAIGALMFYSSITDRIYTSGLAINETKTLYLFMAIAQAVLLLFIVPSLTSTLISSEREKQTLDILLSTKLTAIQIISGKIFSVILKVVIMIIATIPIYTITALIGGIRISDILELIVFFIVNTIFVASIGIFISTIFKVSKVATVVTYLLILFIYVGIFLISLLIMAMQLRAIAEEPTMPMLGYLTPLTGFLSLIMEQLGGDVFRIGSFGLNQNAYIVSIGIQVSVATLLVWISSVILNPIKKVRRK